MNMMISYQELVRTFRSIFLWVIIGVMPVAVAKMAWRFVS
ncbi:hypothetical protein JRT83AECX_JRT83AEC_01187 [Escherichia coli]|nr:hypothetical protein JRT83AECX_JRT83AEC_01187 [Escherichia coli]